MMQTTKPKRQCHVTRASRPRWAFHWFGHWKTSSRFRCLTRARRPRHAADGGATAVEYVLLMIAFVLPMVWLLRVALLGMLIHNYRMVTYWITLPFP